MNVKGTYRLKRTEKMNHPLIKGLMVIWVALVFYLSGILGLSLAIPPGYATALWPPSGIALGVTLIWGYRLWPGIFLGSFLVNLNVILRSGGHEDWNMVGVVAVGIATGSVIQAFLTTWGIRRWVGYPNALIKNTEVFRFYGLAGPVGCLFNATWSLGLLFLTGKMPLDILLRNWLTWWLGDVIGVLIFAPIMLTLFGRPDNAWRFRRRALALPLIMSFCVTALFFYYAQESEHRRQQTELMALNHSASDYVHSAVTRHLEELYALQGLFNASGMIGREEFARFTLPSLQRNRGIQGFSWNARVTNTERAAYESGQQRKAGNDHFEITEKDQSGHFVRAQNYPDHIVVTYIEPFASNARALGYDVGSEPIRRAAINRAMASGRISATAPIRLVQETGQQKGILIFLPVYRHPDSVESSHADPDDIAGFAVEVLRIGDVIENALAVLGDKRSLLKIEVRDRDADSSNRYLYADETTVSQNSLSQTTNLEIGGRNWELVTTVVGDLPGASLNTLYVLVCGTGVTSLLGFLLMILSAHTLNVEAQVRERTAELSRQNQRLMDEVRHRIEAEDALRESETRFRNMADSAPILVFTSTADGERDYFNREWQRFTRQSDGKDWQSVLHPDDLASYLSLKDQATREQKPFSLSYRLHSAEDNTYHWFLDSSAPRFGLDHHFMGFISCCIDISDIKASQAAMQVAKEAAEHANTIKSEFMANLSHELLTPMNAILGLSHLLLGESSLPPEPRSHLEKINLSAQNLLVLLNTLLDFSSLESGKIKIVTATFSWQEHLEKLVEHTRQDAARKGLELIFEADSDIPRYLTGDSSRLTQILANLLSNAVKFTERGQLTLAMALKERAKDSLWITFKVSDTGIGIAPDLSEKLFTPFNQADGSSTRKHGGTGLGLTVARRLIENMGGDIRVESVLGMGSTFTFTLPFQIAQTETHSDAQELETRDLKGKHILLVEDNPLNQMVAQRYLAKLDIIADLAQNGQEALDRVNEAAIPYDAILMDIQMPVMDGLEATRQLRRQFTPENLPIIAVSANTSNQDQENCMAVGMNDFLPKPLNLSDLGRTLGFWLNAQYKGTLAG